MLTIAMGLLAVAIGQPAPPLTLERVLPTNAPATWEALRGRPVVLEFWATWCGPCIHEIPHLNELATKFKDVQFISITDEEPEVVEKFLARHPISGWIGIDRTGTTFRSFGVEGRPHTVLVGADGIIRAITLSNRLTELVIADLASGKPLKAERFAAPRTLPEAGPPVFEIMIRPSRTRGALSMGPGNWYAEGIRLRVLLSMAYSVPESRIEGPKDLLDARFDMRITLPQGASGEVDVLREALERTFKLKARRERREVDALVLRTVSPKLKPTMDTGLGLKGLAEWLERRLKQPVVDETNLAGRYDIDLALDPEQPGALEKALGLKLEPAKRPMEFLVVESGNLPAPIGIQI